LCIAKQIDLTKPNVNNNLNILAANAISSASFNDQTHQAISAQPITLTPQPLPTKTETLLNNILNVNSGANLNTANNSGATNQTNTNNAVNMAMSMPITAMPIPLHSFTSHMNNLNLLNHAADLLSATSSASPSISTGQATTPQPTYLTAINAQPSQQQQQQQAKPPIINLPKNMTALNSNTANPANNPTSSNVSNSSSIITASPSATSILPTSSNSAPNAVFNATNSGTTSGAPPQIITLLKSTNAGANVTPMSGTTHHQIIQQQQPSIKLIQKTPGTVASNGSSNFINTSSPTVVKLVSSSSNSSATTTTTTTTTTTATTSSASPSSSATGLNTKMPPIINISNSSIQQPKQQTLNTTTGTTNLLKPNIMTLSSSGSPFGHHNVISTTGGTGILSKPTTVILKATGGPVGTGFTSNQLNVVGKPALNQISLSGNQVIQVSKINIRDSVSGSPSNTGFSSIQQQQPQQLVKTVVQAAPGANPMLIPTSATISAVGQTPTPVSSLTKVDQLDGATDHLHGDLVTNPNETSSASLISAANAGLGSFPASTNTLIPIQNNLFNANASINNTGLGLSGMLDVSAAMASAASLWHDVAITKELTYLVSEYNVKSSNAHVVDENAMNCLKRKLEPGVAYKFRVAAINACGRGPWSDQSAFQTCQPGFPGAPSNIKISKVTYQIYLNLRGERFENSCWHQNTFILICQY
jgi:hypothetical protein